MSLESTIWAYYLPLHHTDAAIIEYYAEIFEGLNCLTWEATRAKANLQVANWKACQPLAGWNGFALMLPGA